MLEPNQLYLYTVEAALKILQDKILKSLTLIITILILDICNCFNFIHPTLYIDTSFRYTIR